MCMIYMYYVVLYCSDTDLLRNEPFIQDMHPSVISLISKNLPSRTAHTSMCGSV